MLKQLGKFSIEVQAETPGVKEELSRKEIMERYKMAAKRAGLR